MADIIKFDGQTTHDISAENVVQSASEADLEHAVVIGWEKNGAFYLSSSYGDMAHTLWLLEQAKRALFDMADDGP